MRGLAEEDVARRILDADSLPRPGGAPLALCLQRPLATGRGLALFCLLGAGTYASFASGGRVRGLWGVSLS